MRSPVTLCLWDFHCASLLCFKMCDDLWDWDTQGIATLGACTVNLVVTVPGSVNCSLNLYAGSCIVYDQVLVCSTKGCLLDQQSTASYTVLPQFYCIGVGESQLAACFSAFLVIGQAVPCGLDSGWYYRVAVYSAEVGCPRSHPVDRAHHVAPAMTCCLSEQHASRLFSVRCQAPWELKLLDYCLIVTAISNVAAML
jgi:hypothetical protein